MRIRAYNLVILMVLVLCFLFGIDIPLLAKPQQDPNTKKDVFEMSIEELQKVKVETVYGASKYKQKITEAPSSVTIITADEIKKYGYRTLAEILQSVRGFYTTYDRNYNYLGVRGFGRPGDYNSRILLLLDGYRTNDGIYGTASIDRCFYIDVDLIERVEVIRGPGSSIYGSNAFFAVLNVITKKGSDFQGTELSGQIASHDTYEERISYGNKFDNGLEMLFSGSNYDSKGQKLYFKEFDDPSTNYGVAKDADKEKFGNLFSKLSYGDFTLESAYVSRDKRIPTAAYGTVFNDNRTMTTDTLGFTDLKYEHKFENIGEVMGRVYYGFYNYDGDYVYDLSEDEEPWLVVNKDIGKGEWFGSELRLTNQIFERHKLVWGVEYQNNYRQDQENYDVAGVYLDDERNSQFWGIYIQDEFKILDNLIFNAGVRYDEYSEFGGTTNPRLALIYNPFKETTLKFLYGKAFRAPSAYESYFNDGDSTQKANTALKPETIETYEMILEQYLGHGLRGSLSAFTNEIKDLISQQVDPADGLLVFRNSDKIWAKGVEAELNGRWENGWRSRVSYAFVQTEDETTDSWLTNSPKHLGKVNLIAPLLEEKLFAGIELQYTDKVKTLAGRHAHDFFVTNLTLFSKNLAKGLETSVSIYNLFDEKYGHPGSGEHTQDIINQDGRSFMFKLTYRF